MKFLETLRESLAEQVSRIQLSRKSLVILGVLAVVLLTNIYMVLLTVQVAGDKLTLQKQTDLANALVEELSAGANVELTQAELESLQGRLKDVSFPEQPASIELLSVLVKASNETGAEMSNLQIVAVDQEKIGDRSYDVMRQRLQVRGTPTQISSFLSKVENSGMRALVVNNMSMSPKGSVWDARLDLYLYSGR